MRPGLLPRRYFAFLRTIWRPDSTFNEAGAFAPEIFCSALPAANVHGASFNEAGAFAPEIFCGLAVAGGKAKNLQ